MFYNLVVFILLPFFKIFFHLKIFGRENFPLNGPLIVASNHASFFDPIIVGISAPRKLVFLARDSLFRYRFFAKILNWLYAYPLKREGGGDLKAFKLAINKLSDGKAVLVFPEGTRSKDGNLQEAKSGIGFLEVISGANILPCYIKGSLEAWPRHSAFPKVMPISVYFGRPLRFDGKISGDKREGYKHVAEQVMAAIGELKKNANQSGRTMWFLFWRKARN